MQPSYETTTQRPVNYSQNLWKVDDTEIHKPGERFIPESSPYMDAIGDGSIMAPLESAPVPRGLLLFVEDSVKTFGAVASKHSSIEDVIDQVFRWMDYQEFYYLLFNSAVVQTDYPMRFTYRHRRTGRVLSPNSIESFVVAKNYDFPQYRACCEMMKHELVQDVLKGIHRVSPTTGQPITKETILEKLSKTLYGNYDALKSEVEQWVYDFYESLDYSANISDEDHLQLDSNMRVDRFFWEVCTLSILLWLKSKFALRFLSEYHPVYMALFNWDKDKGVVVVSPESGGEAIIDRWDIFTRKHLIVEENTPPGTCEGCKQSLHCTKYINIQALFHPTCSCGQTVNVEDTEYHRHGFNPNCKEYSEKYPLFTGFSCQRCMNMAINKAPPTVKCQRVICPAISCPHHQGMAAHARELTDRRSKMLTYTPA